jgi:flavin reductase (DIM6/NTAB) family NADH-FMN oxidoreductase RutF
MMSVGSGEVEAAAIDPLELRRTFGAFGTGVTVITTRHEGADNGMTANAFMSVSLAPPLLVVSVNRRARILERIKASRRYGVSILAEHMEAIAHHFAGKPRETLTNLFEDFDGLPVIRGALAHFATHLQQTVDAGDHVLFIGAIDKIARRDGRPLMFHDGGFRAIASNWASNATAHSWPAGIPGEPAGYFEETPELW